MAKLDRTTLAVLALACSSKDTTAPVDPVDTGTPGSKPPACACRRPLSASTPTLPWRRSRLSAAMSSGGSAGSFALGAQEAHSQPAHFT
jgi:hypothetical protein